MLELITQFLRATAAFFQWRTNPLLVKRRRRAQLEKQVSDNTNAVIRGDEEALNERLSHLLKVATLAFLVAALSAGCARTRVVYVPESERAVRSEHAGQSGWWLPDSAMARILERLERAAATDN
jgi:hypothetical protein